MPEEIRKRLEINAQFYANKVVPYGRSFREELKKESMDDFKAGAEWMFKECGGMTVLHDMRKPILEQCKEWMGKHIPCIHTQEGDAIYAHGFRHIPMSSFLADFEADMNKLWEEKK